LRARLGAAVEEVGLGRRAADAFADAAGRIGSDAFDLAGATLRLHQRYGGDPVTVLRRVATVVRERRAEDLEIRALTAQARASALVLVAVPAAMAVLLGAGGHGGVSTGVVDLTGWSLLALGGWLLWRISGGTRVSRRRRSQCVPSRLLVALGRHLPAAVRTNGDGQRHPDRQAADAATAVLVSALAAAVAIRLVHGPRGAVAAAAAAAAGWLLPRRRRRRDGELRRRAVEAGLAHACDLVSLALTAGCDVPGAVSAAAPLATGECGERLRSACAAYEVGGSFDDALDEIRAGVGSDTVDELCAVLGAARRDGGAPAETVAAFAADVRLRARLVAQAEARTLPVRLLFPLVFCVLPAFVLLTILPLLSSALGDLQW